MFSQHPKKEVFTIPNLLSLLRLAMIPVCVLLYRGADSSRDYLLAGGILACSCATDLLDGFIARRFHMISGLGKVLDPLADKATQFALTVCLCSRYPVLVSVLVLLIVKESFQIIAGLIHLRRGAMLPGALLAGKVSTAVLFISLILLVALPEVSEVTVRHITLINMLFLTLSFWGYLHAYFGNSGILKRTEP